MCTGLGSIYDSQHAPALQAMLGVRACPPRALRLGGRAAGGAARGPGAPRTAGPLKPKQNDRRPAATLKGCPVAA
jgi:hypothetical protein